MKAVAGMDAALEKAVQANRKALQLIVDQGADLRETQVKKALACWRRPNIDQSARVMPSEY